MRIGKAVLVVLAFGASGAGCASARQTAGTIGESPYGPVKLLVKNNAWADVVIYALRGGQRVRVGTVVATNQASLTLRPDLVGPGGEVRVQAYPIGGGGAYVSPSVFASPGGVVTVSLETDLQRSTIVTW
jgi:hypothetical protein